MSKSVAGSRLCSPRSIRLFSCCFCLVLAYACGADGPTTVPPPPPPPPPPVATCSGPTIVTDTGTVALFLTTADGSYLPLKIFATQAVLDSGALVMRPDSTYQMVTFSRGAHAANTVGIADSIAEHGHYSVCGNKVQFAPAAGTGFSATVLGLTLTTTRHGSDVVPDGAQDTLRMLFTPSVRAALCGDGSADSARLASGSYRLLRVNGSTPPTELPDTYPYAIQIASATATVNGAGYTIEGRGSTTKAGTSDVELFSDTGTIVSCATVWHFRSATQDTMFAVYGSSASLMVPLPPSFIGYDYGFLGDDPPVTLELEKIP